MMERRWMSSLPLALLERGECGGRSFWSLTGNGQSPPLSFPVARSKDWSFPHTGFSVQRGLGIGGTWWQRRAKQDTWDREREREREFEENTWLERTLLSPPLGSLSLSRSPFAFTTLDSLSIWTRRYSYRSFLFWPLYSLFPWALSPLAFTTLTSPILPLTRPQRQSPSLSNVFTLYSPHALSHTLSLIRHDSGTKLFFSNLFTLLPAFSPPVSSSNRHTILLSASTDPGVLNPRGNIQGYWRKRDYKLIKRNMDQGK